MRFVVHESSEGFHKIGASRRGITCTVHDAIYNYRIVGLFQSEGGFKGLGSEGMRTWARNRAERLAALLNSDDLDDAS